MAKAAHVKLSWKRSVSVDVVKVVAVLNNNGEESRVEMTGPDVEELIVVVNATSSFHYTIESTDSEGNTVTSASYDFQLGDLLPPQPATDLTHSIVDVFDIPDVPSGQ